MRKEITYFNFGLLLSILVVALQLVVFLINKLLVMPMPELINLIAPPGLAIILSFFWYKHEKSLLKIEQYLIAIIPLSLFIVIALANSWHNDELIHWHDFLLLIFLTFYVILRISVHKLSLKFHEEIWGDKLWLRSFFYLIFCLFLISWWSYIFFF